MFKTVKDTQAKREAVYTLVRQSRADMGFYFMLGISTLITTLGLTMDSGSVVIGGMLLAPMLTPMLALGLGLVTRSKNSITRSVLGIINSIAAVLTLSFLFSLLIHSGDYITHEILLRSEFSPLYLYVAILSGLGASYSMVDPRISSALPGVAVAVSLLPPLCVSGIAIAQANQLLLTNSFLIFVTNTIGIVVATAAVFAIFRFHKLKHVEEKEIKEEIKEQNQKSK